MTARYLEVDVFQLHEDYEGSSVLVWLVSRHFNRFEVLCFIKAEAQTYKLLNYSFCIQETEQQEGEARKILIKFNRLTVTIYTRKRFRGIKGQTQLESISDS